MPCIEGPIRTYLGGGISTHSVWWGNQPGIEGVAMADFVMVVLRAIHIVGTVFWVGGTLLVAGYHEYVLDPGDPKRTLERMAEYDDMSTMVGMSGMVGVLAGLVLYWLVSNGLDMSWISSTYGTTITIGAVAGIVAVAITIPYVGLTNNKSVALYQEVGDAAELTAEQAETVDRLQARLHTGERWGAIFMVIAVLAMSTAQYM